jgi:hypothetical protein
MDKDEHIKEVYAYFGLSMYMAQVLEHGIVNAFVFLELMPKTKGKWTPDEFEAYMDGEFDKTLGRLIGKLRKLTTINNDMESLLTVTLKKRNWLAHHYFRDRAKEFMNSSGRDSMILELQQCRDLFKETDEKLEAVIMPLMKKVGITDEILREHLLKFKKKANADL